MTPEERRDHLRRIGSLGGKRTVEKHGRGHMQTIGRKGFQVAKNLGWGPQLAAKLAPSYEAKFGRPITLSQESREHAAVRAEARKVYAGRQCDRVGCDQPGQVHHIGSVDAENPNAVNNIAIYCAKHHRELHQHARQAHREARHAS